MGRMSVVTEQPYEPLDPTVDHRSSLSRFAELQPATAGGMPGIEKLAAITAKYDVTIAPPAA
jgi:hypothetical protein